MRATAQHHRQHGVVDADAENDRTSSDILVEGVKDFCTGTTDRRGSFTPGTQLGGKYALVTDTKRDSCQRVITTLTPSLLWLVVGIVHCRSRPCFNTLDIMAEIGVKEMYLLAYNASCAIAWALVLRLAIFTLVDDVPGYGVAGALARVYAAPDLAMLLTAAQCAALLEIVHSAIGVVRSPVVVTSMQVSSRIVALFALVNSPQAQGKNNYGGKLYTCNFPF